jgi:hypothetical protein
MRIWQKLVVALAAATGLSITAGVTWFVLLLVTSPSEPDGFGQDHQEQWAVATCWRDIRDGRIASTDQCNDYAQSHLEFFSNELAADAATTTCRLSRSHLAYARKNSPEAKALLTQLNGEVHSDCSYPGTYR